MKKNLSSDVVACGAKIFKLGFVLERANCI